MCGNHHGRKYFERRRAGSPPRVREPRAVLVRPWHLFRITPACAGTTHTFPSICSVCRDHPRVCGNHSGIWSMSAGMKGSPPRVREPRAVLVRPWHLFRITPACAGTTVVFGRCRQGYEDHPRVCGNHSVISTICGPG